MHQEPLINPLTRQLETVVCPVCRRGNQGPEGSVTCSGHGRVGGGARARTRPSGSRICCLEPVAHAIRGCHSLALCQTWGRQLGAEHTAGGLSPHPNPSLDKFRLHSPIEDVSPYPRQDVVLCPLLWNVSRIRVCQTLWRNMKRIF